MKTTLLRNLIMIFVSVLALSGCILPTNLNDPSVQAELNLPLPNSTYPLGQSVSLDADALLARFLAITVDRFTFYADGRQIAEFPTALGSDPRSPFAEGSWTPPAAGEYQIQVWAHLSNGRLAISDPARICVLPALLPTATDAPATESHLGIDGYTGPCEIPSTLVSDPSAAVSLSTSASPASLGLRGPLCPSVNPAIITFRASVADPGNRVAFVIVDVYTSFSDPPESVLQAERVGLIQTSSSAPDRTFTGSTYDLSITRIGESGTDYYPTLVHWTAQAFDSRGSILATDGPHEIPSAPCTPPGALTYTTPTPSVLIILPSSTPASVADCPPGTYFADVTHKCIPIATPTTGNGGSGAVCSNITSDSVCNSTPGCTYNYGLKKCQKK